ncbi:hypothetical protein J2X76_005438 [Neorhizobium sp. 2083]|uniref:hypothetical protein n=1 Tax=Neorhizobium sp. 2083 TaxID=2817762 RepID=UPI00286016BA|nr:hypothetical protein [Neorhizobium sp. 2083]MDR6820241.1 hypothetical protein [Neorhizobium sp. 2083]
MTAPHELEEKIQAFIVEKVSYHWANTGTAYLLSRLGYEIKRAFPNYLSVMPKGIKNYVREWPSVVQVEFPGVPEKAGLVPLDAKLPADITAAFQSRSDNISKGPVYENAFWDAFTRKMEDKRYISLDLDENIVVSEKYPPDSMAKTWELTDNDIIVHPPGTPIPEKVRTTHQKIDEWLSRHEIERTHFLKVRNNHPLRSSSSSMLEALFSRLSQEEQSRVVIPMDILLKLIAAK